LVPVPEIVLAHDYLVQIGGAERVVAGWAAAFNAQTVVTLAYSPERTFDEFRRLDVRSSIPRALAQQVERMLPTLPSIAERTSVSGGDIALVSTSGWAHRFDFKIPHVVYAHSPARWLYAAEDYLLRLSPFRRAGLRASTPLLRRGDLTAMRRARAIVSNSVVTRDRMRAAYGLDSVIVNPPVEPVAREARPPSRQLPDEFVMVVARDRGYKNVTLAVAAAQMARMSIVIVGPGSKDLDDPERGVHGLGRVTDSELCWLYREASVIIGAGREDFGLTIVEAALEGTPAAAIPSGGYLETVRDGVNGYHAASATPEALATAIIRARGLDADDCRAWGRRFSRDEHLARLDSVMEEVVHRV
jgi:glycosyltransferase involved in cell wall biosynthesis